MPAGGGVWIVEIDGVAVGVFGLGVASVAALGMGKGKSARGYGTDRPGSVVV